MKKILRKILLLGAILTFFIDTTYACELDKKIGQLLIVGFDGNSIHSVGFKKVINKLKKGDISGVILFSKNIKSRKDLVQMTEKIKQTEKYSHIKPIISIDNEGGYVQRYKFEKYKSAKKVANLGEKSAIKEYSKMAQDEKNLGINFNFAPCVDLAVEKNSIIELKERSYGKNSDEVTKYAKIFLQEHNKQGIATSIKHFPGHGSVVGDTHKGFTDATNTFVKEEIDPYKNLINENILNTVMVSHIYNEKFDREYPASLSKKTIKKYLRKKLKFNGVVVSDDFDMGAIKNNYSLNEILIKSIGAGVNLLIFSGNISKDDKDVTYKFHKIIKQEIKNNNISIEDIDNSYKKVLELKSHL